MNWLVPAIAATLTNSLVLALVYLYLSVREGEPSMRVLFWSWLAYSLRFVIMLLHLGHGFPVLLAANQLCILVSSYLLLSGFRLWLGRTAVPVGWSIAGASVFVWIVVAGILQLDLALFSIPVSIYSGLLFIRIGVLFLRESRFRGGGTLIVGVTFVIWGVHKLDYPFLRPIEWVAPWGYLLGAVAATIAGIGIILIYFEKTRDELAASVRDREILFREVHHRVKNNLQIVNALLEFHQSTRTDVSFRESVTTIQNRVSSMALLHEQLYRSGQLAAVNSTDYLGELVGRIRATVDPGAAVAELTVDVDSVSLPIDVAIPLGLIANELVSNALKHAFAGLERGTVALRFVRDPERGLVLTVADDGVGFSGPSAASRGVGWQLVTSLAEQIGGEVETGADGSMKTCVTVSIAECPGVSA